MLSSDQHAVIRRRGEEALREIGILLIAFAPLDAIGWNNTPFRWRLALTFLVFGLLLVGSATTLEVSRERN